MLSNIFGSKGKAASADGKTESKSSLQLHAAAKSGDANALAAALKSATHIDAFDGDGQTALSLAIGKGHEQIVAQLLESGASVAVKHKHKSSLQTPRELAVEKGKKHLIQMLDVAEARAMKYSLFYVLKLPTGSQAWSKCVRFYALRSFISDCALYRFLKSEFSEENCIFFDAIEELRSAIPHFQGDEEVKISQEIWRKFLSNDGELQVAMTSALCQSAKQAVEALAKKTREELLGPRVYRGPFERGDFDGLLLRATQQRCPTLFDAHQSFTFELMKRVSGSVIDSP